LLDEVVIANLRLSSTISVVILSGKFFARADLDQMLAQAGTAAGRVK
jgi:hypothetical protein